MSATQLQCALNLIKFLDDRKYASLENLLSENFTHAFLPATLGGLGEATRNKQVFMSYAKELELVFERFNFQKPTEIIQSQDVVVIHTHSDGKTISGKPYKNEYIFTIRFDNDKILSIKEYLDSKYITEVLEAEAAITQRK